MKKSLLVIITLLFIVILCGCTNETEKQNTSKNEISSYVVEYFEHPEEYEKFNYEHVYAITVMFSQKPLIDRLVDIWCINAIVYDNPQNIVKK